MSDVWTVDFQVSVTVEADSEEQAIFAGISKVTASDFDWNEVEPFDFRAWRE